MLNHITQTQAGQKKWEGMQTDNFRVTFLFSPAVADEPLLTEHVMSVTGWKTPEIEIKEQDQGASRLFAANTIKTRQDLTFTLTLNFNDENNLYVYTALKQVKMLTSNHDTFSKGLKKDYMFDVMVEFFLRNDQKIYERVAKNCIITTFGDNIFDADITDSELKTLEMGIVAEYYNENAI